MSNIIAVSNNSNNIKVTVKLTDRAGNSSGWYEYTVPIHNADLETDGRYEIVLTDHDMTGNTRANGVNNPPPGNLQSGEMETAIPVNRKPAFR